MDCSAGMCVDNLQPTHESDAHSVNGNGCHTNGNGTLSKSDGHSSSQEGFPPPIYIVSTSTGYNAEQRVRIVLAQFPKNNVPVVKQPNVLSEEQVAEIVERCKSTGGLIVHTLMCDDLRHYLIQLCTAEGVDEYDLTGPLLDRLSATLGRRPVGEPGLYRKLHKAEFDRISAIEYTLAHDDGKKPGDWPLADIVIMAPSRAGKTPLSVYLSVLGWKVANIPLVMGLQLPEPLKKVDPRRVIGLSLDPSTLQVHRESRALGVKNTSYTDPDIIKEELREAERFYRRNGFCVVNIVDRAIESCADEVIKKVSCLPRNSSLEALGTLYGTASLQK